MVVSPAATKYEHGVADRILMPCSAGLVIGLINDIPTCQDLVARIVKEAEGVVQSLHSRIRITSGEEAWDRAASGRMSKL